MTTAKKTPGAILDSDTGALAKRLDFEPGAVGYSRVEYSERFLESLLVVNPSLLDVEGHTPLVVHGGQNSADQVYCDDLGRLVAVECKSGTANETDLVQLLGYGHQLPFEPRASEAETRLLGADALMLRADEPLQKLCTDLFSVDTAESIATRKAAIDKRLGKASAVDELTKRTMKRLGLRDFAPSTPDRRFETSTRMVLAARGFTEPCEALATALNARTIDVTLLKIDVFDGPEGRIVASKVVHEPVKRHAVRRAIGHVWRNSSIRARYVPEGWYFAKVEPCFTFVGRDDFDSCFWLEHAGDDCVVRMFGTDQRVAKMLVGSGGESPPEELSKGSKGWEWRGRWNAEEWARAAIAMGDALFAVFGPKD